MMNAPDAFPGRLGIEVPALLLRCREGRADAWRELWILLASASDAVLGMLVRREGLDPTLVDDLRQELFLHFWKRSGVRLSRFRGSDEIEFRAFVRSCAVRFAYRALHRARRAALLERAAIDEYAARRGFGTSVDEVEILAWIAEIAGKLSDEDRDRLQSWTGDARPPGSRSTASPRTLRRREARLKQIVMQWIQ